jgi:nifR3 family TIM-barrel protein
MKAVSSSTKKPVTAKIRLGFDKEHVNAVEVAKILEENGAAAVAVHGRTREQFYSGEADWEMIAGVKEALTIPVIGNGDVKDAESAKKMYEVTGCDAIMVGRAARGNPWIFASLAGNGTGGKPAWEEVREMIIRHAKMLCAEKGEYTAIREMRQHVAWYSAGYRGASILRREICNADTLDSFIDTLCGYRV